MTTIRVLVVDDHPVFREGLKMLLPLVANEITVVGLAADGNEAIEMIGATAIDVVLLDIKMPGMGGVEAARIIAERFPAVVTIMLTTFDERQLVYEALRAGAVGYLLKDTPVEQIVDAIRNAHSGNVLISSKAVSTMIDTDDEAEISPAQQTLSSLSPRQQEVFSLMINGMDNARIAKELNISERTVRNYISRIYESIGVHNRSQVIVWAQAYDLV